MTVLTMAHHIEAARLLTLRKALQLELKGMQVTRGRTAYAVLKSMGLKGSRESVLQQLDEWRDDLLAGCCETVPFGPSPPVFQTVGDIVNFKGESK